MKVVVIVLFALLATTFASEIKPTVVVGEVVAPTKSTPHPIKASLNVTCCNKCHPEIVHVPKYKYKIHIVEVPYPVFKKSHDLVDKCPKDFEQVDESCVKKINQKGACPPGWFRIDDDTCAKVLKLNVTKWEKEDVDVELECPQGWKRVSAFHCIRERECPQEGGYKMIGGKCVHVPISCPEGYKRIGKSKCIHIHFKCPPGHTYVKRTKSCQKQRPVKCPQGYKLIPGTQKCILERCASVKCEPKPASCPEGKVWKIPRGKCCPEFVDCNCPMDWRAVCSTDGTTYPNECVARCLGACIKKQGPCTPDEPPKPKCPPSWGKEQTCEEKCEKEPFEPVCSTSGITLPNACVADCFKETVAYNGKCKLLCH